MEQLKTILIELKKILGSEEVKMVCDTSMILDCASRIYMTHLIGAKKTVAAVNPNPTITMGQDGVKMASDKQKMWLGKMNYNGDVDKATSREAKIFLDSVWGNS